MFCAPTMTTMICVPYFFFPKWKECFVLKGETNAPAMTRTCVYVCEQVFCFGFAFCCWRCELPD